MQTRSILFALLGITACDGKVIDVRPSAKAEDAGGTTTVSAGTAGAFVGGGGSVNPTDAQGGTISSQALGGVAGIGFMSAEGASFHPEASGGTGEAGVAGSSTQPEAGAAGTAEDIQKKITECIESSDTPAVLGTFTGASEEWGPIKLVILGASEAGGICGTVAFGNDPAPAPPTDPSIGWPPAYRELLATDNYIWRGNTTPAALGYPYPFASPRSTGLASGVLDRSQFRLGDLVCHSDPHRRRPR